MSIQTEPSGLKSLYKYIYKENVMQKEKSKIVGNLITGAIK